MHPQYRPFSRHEGFAYSEDLYERPNPQTFQHSTTNSGDSRRDSRSTINEPNAPPPPRPEPPQTPFMCFAKHREDEIKRGHLKMEASVRVRRIADEWRNISEEDRAHWDEEARKDKIRYDTLKRNYNGWAIPKRRAKKHPLAPKRPMSAFLRYSQSRRKMMKQKNPDMNNTDISRLLGEMWHNAPEPERAPYVQKELEERAEYKVAIAKWRLEHEQAEMEKKKKTSPDSVRNTDQVHLDSKSFDEQKEDNENKDIKPRTVREIHGIDWMYHNEAKRSIQAAYIPPQNVAYCGGPGIDNIHQTQFSVVHPSRRAPSPYFTYAFTASGYHRQSEKRRYYSSPPTVPGIATGTAETSLGSGAPYDGNAPTPNYRYAYLHPNISGHEQEYSDHWGDERNRNRKPYRDEF